MQLSFIDHECHHEIKHCPNIVVIHKPPYGKNCSAPFQVSKNGDDVDDDDDDDDADDDDDEDDKDGDSDYASGLAKP